MLGGEINLKEHHTWMIPMSTESFHKRFLPRPLLSFKPAIPYFINILSKQAISFLHRRAFHVVLLYFSFLV